MEKSETEFLNSKFFWMKKTFSKLNIFLEFLFNFYDDVRGEKKKSFSKSKFEWIFLLKLLFKVSSSIENQKGRLELRTFNENFVSQKNTNYKVHHIMVLYQS